MADDDQKHAPEPHPENQPEKDAVWDLMPDPKELEAFRKMYRRRFVVHLVAAFFAVFLLGFIAYSGIFELPSGKPDPAFVSAPVTPAPDGKAEAEAAADDPLARIREELGSATAVSDLETLKKELESLLEGAFKDDPEALKLYYEVCKKISSAEVKK